MPTDSFFHYKRRRLHCEAIPLETLAAKFQTPLFVTSKHSILGQFEKFEHAFGALPHLTCYSVKANFNLAVIRTLVEAGSGLDVNSAGELYRALKAGGTPEKIIMAGVGKTAEEIEYALRKKILMLKAESVSELKVIDYVAAKLKVKARVGLRINPNVLAETHPYITTGDNRQKFGIDEEQSEQVLRLVKKLTHIHLTGLEMHLGSQIFDTKPYLEATHKLLAVRQLAASMGFEITHIDVGGGFPVSYSDQPATDINMFAEQLVPVLKASGARILFEPGRYLVGNASVLLTKVLYRKENSRGKKFMVLDAAMTELIRPTLYGAYHDILPVKETSRKVIIDVVGPVCESGDFFAKERGMADAAEGDLVAITSAGAYGAVMSSNYNARLRAA
ncbi:MAG: diaminopimelate decarboxylase, partial [Rhizobacter sp.]|nr:diaminopimelate decarboxylase [Chlorobiales bacterium]